MRSRYAFRMRLFGLTGGIASGKSAVGRMLRGAGVAVIDADVLAREAVAPGSPGLSDVIARFGPLLDDSGALDRKKLGAIVFADDAARRDLNAIVHPRVGELALLRLAALRESGVDVAVYEVPLLFESGLEGMMDATVLVAAPLDLQRERLKARDGIDDDAANARIAAQMPLDEKRKRATVIIENAGTLDDLARAVRGAWRTLTGAELDVKTG